MKTQVEYLTNAPDDAYPTDLVMVDGREVRLRVTTNEGDASRSVGVFRMQPPQDKANALLRAVQDSGFADVVPPPPVEPGSAVRRLTYTQGSDPALTRFASESQVAGPGFAQAESAAVAIIKDTVGFPVQTVSMGFSLLEAPQAGTDLKFRLSLFATGSEAVHVAAPEHWAAQNVTITLAAERSNIPPDALSIDYQTFLELTANNLASPIASSESMLSIEAGTQLAMDFTANLDIDAGEYVLWVSLEFGLLDGGGQEVLRVELVSPRIAYRQSQVDATAHAGRKS